MTDGLANYASPILRAAVFRQLHPDAHITYTVVPIEEAFPEGHRDYEGKATQAIRCEIVWPDGRYVVAHKEMDLQERKRDGKTVAVPQTPEQLAKDETKALGRALRDLGIPQRLTELQTLMRWLVALRGGETKPQPAARQQSTTGSAWPPDSSDPSSSEDDSPDAGADEPTAEQVLAQKFSQLNGADKVAVSAHARSLGVANIMRAGDHAEALIAYIESSAWLTAEPDAETEATSEPARAPLGSRARPKPNDKEGEPF